MAGASPAHKAQALIGWAKDFFVVDEVVIAGGGVKTDMTRVVRQVLVGVARDHLGLTHRQIADHIIRVSCHKNSVLLYKAYAEAMKDTERQVLHIEGQWLTMPQVRDAFLRHAGIGAEEGAAA